MLQEQVKVMSHQGWQLELSRGNISTYLPHLYLHITGHITIW